MKKIIYAFLIIFSFCLINSGDAVARRVERNKPFVNNDGNTVKSKTITKKNGTVMTKVKIYDKNGKRVDKYTTIDRLPEYKEFF